MCQQPARRYLDLGAHDPLEEIEEEVHRGIRLGHRAGGDDNEPRNPRGDARLRNGDETILAVAAQAQIIIRVVQFESTVATAATVATVILFIIQSLEKPGGGFSS